MKKIALSSFACDPTKGSEPGNGWNWAIGLAKKGYNVHCFTRISGRANIEKMVLPNNLTFHYIQLPYGGEQLYHKSTLGMYLYYILWQWLLYKKVRVLNKKLSFDLAHHVTWGSTQMGSFLYKLNIPFIFGPAGGGQIAPASFRSYFGNHWSSEINRERITALMVNFNPACKSMLKKAHAVLVSNPDTARMAKKAGAKNVVETLDAALPMHFFPSDPPHKVAQTNNLKLLWTGRFLPRKGILLLLDVMNELKNFPQITLTVVGDGETKGAFLETIKAYDLHKTVIYQGLVSYETIKSYYASHDAFIFTSLRDSCPAQLIEAMAYSLPVITLNLHGQAIIVNEKTGIKCECPNPQVAIQQLKDAILKFYSEPELMLKMGSAAYDFALNQTWENKIDQIIKNHYPKF